MIFLNFCAFCASLWLAVDHGSSDPLAMESGITKHRFRRLAALVIQLQIVFPRKADSAVYLHAAITHLAKCVGTVSLRNRNSRTRRWRAFSYCPGGVVSCRSCAFRHQEHVRALVLNGLKRSDGSPELMSGFSVLNCRIENPLHAANHLGTQRDGCNVGSLYQRATRVAISAEDIGSVYAHVIELDLVEF